MSSSDTEADLKEKARNAVWRLSNDLRIKRNLILEMQNQFDTLLNQIPPNVPSLRRGPIFPRDVHNRLASLASLCRRFALGARDADPLGARDADPLLKDIVALFNHWEFPVDLTPLQQK